MEPENPLKLERTEPKTRREVMIVEDDKEMLFLYRRMLSFYGFDVELVAQSIRETREIFNRTDPSSEIRPSIMIIDNRLPDGFGKDLSAELLIRRPI